MSNLIPGQDTAARLLEMLTLDEDHDLLRLLQLIVADGMDELSEEAEWFPPGDRRMVSSENRSREAVLSAGCLRSQRSAECWAGGLVVLPDHEVPAAVGFLDSGAVGDHRAQSPFASRPESEEFSGVGVVDAVVDVFLQWGGRGEWLSLPSVSHSLPS
ncbi:hypothetical protein [Streptomyces sp. NPDC055006]